MDKSTFLKDKKILTHFLTEIIACLEYFKGTQGPIKPNVTSETGYGFNTFMDKCFKFINSI